MSRPSAAQGFAFSREQFQQILEDTLASARRLGATDAGAEVSAGEAEVDNLEAETEDRRHAQPIDVRQPV